MFDRPIPPFKKPTILVPIPPSKAKDHPEYDDRMIQLAHQFALQRENAEVRELITLKQTVEASHLAEKKRTIEKVLENLQLDLSLCKDGVEHMILMDDVLTTGAHFKACQQLLQNQFGQAKIIGIFIARRKLEG